MKIWSKVDIERHKAVSKGCILQFLPYCWVGEVWDLLDPHVPISPTQTPSPPISSSLFIHVFFLITVAMTLRWW